MRIIPILDLEAAGCKDFGLEKWKEKKKKKRKITGQREYPIQIESLWIFDSHHN